MSRDQKDESNSLPLLLDIAGVARAISISKATIYRMISAGEFPRGKPATAGCVRWHRNIVEEWAAEKGL